MAKDEDRNWIAPIRSVRNAFAKQTDIFSTLLLLGPDVLTRAVAQQGGSRCAGIPLPVAFSFGTYHVKRCIFCQSHP